MPKPHKPNLNKMIYLPDDIRKQWDKRGGYEYLIAFLRDGVEFCELYAKFKAEALDYLKKREKLNKVLCADADNN